MTVLDETLNAFKFFTNSLLFKSMINEADDIEVYVENEVDPIRQEIIRHLAVYEIAISLIKDNIDVMKERHVSKVRDVQYEKLRALFVQAYLFLKLFVLNNYNNQNILAKYLVIFVIHIELDLGQVELLNEIFRDN